MSNEQSDNKKQATVMLVAFNNVKALGVRYLETALRDDGYNVVTVFFGDFDSAHPRATTKVELDLLCAEIARTTPQLIALSVMSSMYLDTIEAVIASIQGFTKTPVVCGGAFASLCPEYFLDRGIEYVIRTDGELPICQLADALRLGQGVEDVSSLTYRVDGVDINNPVVGAKENIDEYGLPTINSQNACHIHNDTITMGDPQLDTLSYELVASRGCPFTCSYCSCVALKRLFPSDMKYVRTRTVESVIKELVIAKRECKRLVFIHFYDEIFPNSPGWIDEFVVQYKKHINLPFTIWGHPKAVNTQELKKLVDAGLMEVIMGIQSGSDRVRRDIFHRFESRQDIIDATHSIKDAGVFWASYDFMLQHPFETIEDLKETYYLVKDLRRPFELQLHGLNFLPKTDIVPMAIEQGFLTEEELQHIMYAPTEEQFQAYWKQENDLESKLWYRMTYCLQFNSLRSRIAACEADPMANQSTIDRSYETAKKYFKMRYYFKKGRIAIKRLTKI